MSQPERSDTDTLAKLIDANNEAWVRSQEASNREEPIHRAARDARAAIYWEAARIIINDPSQAAEVMTQLCYDGGITRADPNYIAQDIAHAIQFRLSEILREAWPQ